LMFRMYLDIVGTFIDKNSNVSSLYIFRMKGFKGGGFNFVSVYFLGSLG
jgi:hypothetical protein